MSTNRGVETLHAGDPERLGDYRIVGKIGRGGMGTVYLAESADAEQAAVKVINPDLAHDPAFRDRFRREVEAARRVRRFCTAPVLDAMLDGEFLYIVTEYVDGPDLARFVRESGPMRGSNLEHLAVGVATALTAIHGAGIVHRDLKPANVLLSSMGPRVIDFGIARALDAVTEATRSGHLVGTPAYMAPEVIKGERATPASDVFAWGAVVAFAGTGRAPFTGGAVPAVLYKITHGEPQLAGLDDGIRPLVERALAKDPSRRPTAQELLDGLVGRPYVPAAEVADTVTEAWSLGPITGMAVEASGHDGRRRSRTSATLLAPPNGIPPSSDRTRARRPVLSTARRWALSLAGAGVASLLLLVVVLARSQQGPPENTDLLWSTDFSGTTGPDWQTGNASRTASLVNGRYRLKLFAGKSDSQAAPLRNEPPNHVLVSADVSVVSGRGHVGLWCRGPDPKRLDGYVFLISTGGGDALIRKVVGAGAVSNDLKRVTGVKGFEQAGINHLQIACEPAGEKVRLRLWLNGRFVAEHTDAGDPPLSTGQVGIVATADDGTPDGLITDFDNFKIAEIKD